MKILLLAVLIVAGAATAGVVAHASASKTTIRVSEREFKIGLSAKSAPAGVVQFQIRNTGKLAHAFEIAGPGLKKRTPLIKPGKSAVLSATLRAGSYSLWCPIHAAQGMKAALTVKGAATNGGGATSTSSGGDSGGTTTSSGVPWG